jgi:pyruvate dehydrogenase E2 component (dihydrolipoamide acetyltransferase)
MQKIIKLPQVALNLENAVVIEISAVIGEMLRKDDLLLTIETQKATEELPCGESGYLRALLVNEGDEVNAEDTLAVLTDELDENFEIPPSKEPVRAARVETEGEENRRESESPRVDNRDQTVRAAPAARRRAREIGVNIRDVRGSGPAGRITVADVEAHEVTSGQQAGTARPEGEALTTGRRALIEQMVAGNHEIPQFSVAKALDVSEIADGPEGTTFTSRLIYYVGRALAKHEALRSYLKGDRLVVGPIAVAVVMDTRYGLIAPVVRSADQNSHEATAKQLAEFRRRGDQHQLSSNDLKEGLFAVSNLGMLGVDLFTPLVFAGQTAVLAVGRMVSGRNGRPSAWVTLAADHRVVDGAEAARFLRTLESLTGGEDT